MFRIIQGSWCVSFRYVLVLVVILCRSRMPVEIDRAGIARRVCREMPRPLRVRRFSSFSFVRRCGCPY